MLIQARYACIGRPSILGEHRVLRADLEVWRCKKTMQTLPCHTVPRRQFGEETHLACPNVLPATTPALFFKPAPVTSSFSTSLPMFWTFSLQRTPPATLPPMPPPMLVNPATASLVRCGHSHRPSSRVQHLTLLSQTHVCCTAVCDVWLVNGQPRHRLRS